MNQPQHDRQRMQSKMVRTKTGPVHIYESGHGYPIFLIHGLPGTGLDFRFLAPCLAASGLRAIGIDLPGFGRTPRETMPATDRQSQVQLLLSLAQSLEIPNFAIAGHSFGGSLAMRTAAAAPETIGGLALINSIGRKRHHVLPPVPRTVFGLVARAMVTPVIQGALLHRSRRMYRQMGFPDHFDHRDFAHHTGFLHHLDFSVHADALKRLQCPTLVVSAEDDPFIEREISFDLAQAIPSSVHQCHLHYRKGGHYLQKHRAKEIAAHIAAIINHSA